MAIAALIVSIVAILVAGFVARQVESSGFKAEEQFKADLVNLLAALRGLIVKGILADQDQEPRSTATELDVIRGFQASTSGIALSAWAVEKGVGDGPVPGRWRTLSMNLGELAGAMQSGKAEDNVRLRDGATEVELTLDDLASKEVRIISRKVGDLPAFFGSLKETRQKDILLRPWFEIYNEIRLESDPKLRLPQLEALRAAGVDDPDLDLWLAFLNDDVPGLKRALDRGANKGISPGEVLRRHESRTVTPSSAASTGSSATGPRPPASISSPSASKPPSTSPRSTSGSGPTS
jgi:hypothetical protein